MAIAVLKRVGGGVGAALFLVVALTACTARAGTVALSGKSYFIDTRKPIVGMSDSARLNTTAVGMYIIVR